jgi:hypothetical protein
MACEECGGILKNVTEGITLPSVRGTLFNCYIPKGYLFFRLGRWGMWSSTEAIPFLVIAFSSIYVVHTHPAGHLSSFHPPDLLRRAKIPLLCHKKVAESVVKSEDRIQLALEAFKSIAS